MIDALDAGANLQHCYANGITPFLNERDRKEPLHLCLICEMMVFSTTNCIEKAYRLSTDKHAYVHSETRSNFHAKWQNTFKRDSKIP